MGAFGVLLLLLAHRILRRQSNLPRARELWLALRRWERVTYLSMVTFVVAATVLPAAIVGSPIFAIVGLLGSMLLLWAMAMIFLLRRTVQGRPTLVGTSWNGSSFTYTSPRGRA